MYQKPALERFGTFRDLTQSGCLGPSDNATFNGAPSTGNAPDPANGYTFCFDPATAGSR